MKREAEDSNDFEMFPTVLVLDNNIMLLRTARNPKIRMYTVQKYTGGT